MIQKICWNCRHCRYNIWLYCEIDDMRVKQSWHCPNYAPIREKCGTCKFFKTCNRGDEEVSLRSSGCMRYSNAKEAKQ